jgi:RNA polymerase sigma-70 factor (ECF subfamily)
MATVEAELKNLMLAGLEGDGMAHRKLLVQLSARLRAYYKTRLEGAGRNANEAEDLVQEALLAIHIKRHTYDPAEPFTPWAYAIARYKLVDYLRATRGPMTDVPIEEATELSAQDDHIGSESAYDLRRLLDHLPSKMRQTIQCVKIEGLSVAEAARRCSISESSVKINVYRGLRRLAAAITRERRSYEDG